MEGFMKLDDAVILRIEQLCLERNMTKYDLYKVPEDGFELFNTKTNLYEQYNDIYSYGVKYNSDKLYNENFAMFAPLHLNEILPDFFLIFRVDTKYSNNLSSNILLIT